MILNAAQLTCTSTCYPDRSAAIRTSLNLKEIFSNRNLSPLINIRRRTQFVRKTDNYTRYHIYDIPDCLVRLILIKYTFFSPFSQLCVVFLFLGALQPRSARFILYFLDFLHCMHLCRHYIFVFWVYSTTKMKLFSLSNIVCVFHSLIKK